MEPNKQHPGIIEIGDADFEQSVIKADKPVVVDFWGPHCGPCRMLMPVLDKLGLEYQGRITIAKLNTEEHGEKAREYDVRGIPTLLFFNKGELLNRQVGNPGYSPLHALFEEHLTAAGANAECCDEKLAAEVAFAQAMEQVDADYMSGIEKELEAYQSAAEPFQEEWQHALERLDAQQEAGELNDEEYRQRLNEAYAPIAEATKPQGEALHEAVERASVVRQSAIQNAIEAYTKRLA